jgi:hypothetical protein
MPRSPALAAVAAAATPVTGPQAFAHAIASASALRPPTNPTTFLPGAGAIWTGTDDAVSAEVLWPLNGAAGHNIGAVAQFQRHFDDLMRNTLRKPIPE